MHWTACFTRNGYRLRLGVGLAAAGLLMASPPPAHAGQSVAMANPAPAVSSPAADWEKYATPKADRIVIHKSIRQMQLLRGDTVLRTYHIALGRQPAGQKIEAGDGRTPEGTYFIDRRKMESDYHLALHISYPDEFDIKRAAAQGLNPGGSIMIHGQPVYLTPEQRKLLKKDWTAGCVALTDPEIDEVWRLVDDGTPVDIYP
jgi:murein L,D-transpeptidase YafK